ncbi:MAG: DUF448 domain-containing protein [Fusobacteriaceae bacterium]|nr:DUF448 domain-containing protein [Fusobacteriaceae bacterium]MBN2837316.1 DUF448 domain-containing protein [Fusobacteriaceae bacterium]
MIKPQRMCIVCRKSIDKDKLFRMVENEGNYIFDEKQTMQSRGIYVCESLNCLEKLSKHKKYKVLMKDLAEIASRAKKRENKLMNSLKMMKNSKTMTFGMELVQENIAKVNLIILAKDCNKKNTDKILSICKERNIRYIITASKKELGEVFSKEEINVLGVMDKKSAQGLLD